ncbi:hydrogenase [Streptomyces sp. LP11]|uniref:Hydrogenase n=1 Tax=Streptomyces pyxinicus TaxID=2970331 RepID=A0ABT2B592_9ACTN|nr:hydrogenase [Streptomyces sp. LP11]MCS0603685.1 hydrogenase [Streptomyces sp. LP11]
MNALLAAGNAPTTFEGATNTVAVLLLLTEFAMLRASLSRSQVHLYAVQSFLVSVLAVIVAAARDLPELYALAVVSLLLKAGAVPWLINRLLRDARVEIAGSGAIGVASATLLSLALAGFGFFAVGSLDIRSRFLPHAALGLSVSIVLVAFVLMIVRRDVVSQAVGFFSLENGVSLASLVVAAGMPLIIEVAFLFDLLVAVVVFGVLMRVHHHRTASLSTESLTSLQG